MVDFKTKKKVKLEEVKIDNKEIYMNLETGTILEISKRAKELEKNKENVGVFIDMAKLIFEEDFKLVSKLELEDFYTVMELVTKYIEKMSETFDDKKYTQKFKAE